MSHVIPFPLHLRINISHFNKRGAPVTHLWLYRSIRKKQRERRAEKRKRILAGGADGRHSFGGLIGEWSPRNR